MNNLSLTTALQPQLIEPRVLKVIEILQDKQFKTYVVGGCVRDLLLGIQPKDFDVVTEARPNQAKRLIKNAYIIGRRFRLVLVRRGDMDIEVATFRSLHTSNETLKNGTPTDNIFGTPEEDAQRRDFTINGLFYDPLENKMIDYCGGMKDLKLRVLRMIGDPSVRLPEDPIRIFRAIRLAHKVEFRLDTELREQMKAQAFTLQEAALPRIREEFIKIFHLKKPLLALLEAYDLDILKHCSPQLHKAMSCEVFQRWIDQYPQLKLDPPNPLWPLGHLCHAYVRSFIQEDPQAKVSSKELLEHKDLQQFMKNELGIFKYEQNYICQALQMVPDLENIKKYNKKSASRKKQMLSSPAFILALEFGKQDVLLSGPQILFWENELAKKERFKD